MSHITSISVVFCYAWHVVPLDYKYGLFPMPMPGFGRTLPRHSPCRLLCPRACPLRFFPCVPRTGTGVGTHPIFLPVFSVSDQALFNSMMHKSLATLQFPEKGFPIHRSAASPPNRPVSPRGSRVVFFLLHRGGK